MEGALIVFSILAFAAFFIWNRTRDNLERRRLELDAQEKMLERIGPGEALTEFLRTDEGKRFFDQLTASQSAPTRSKDPRRTILVLTTLGLIALLGGVFMVNAVLIPNLLVADPEISLDVLPLVASPAILLTGAGVGALLAAWIMHRLSKKWGMLEAQEPDESAD